MATRRGQSCKAYKCVYQGVELVTVYRSLLWQLTRRPWLSQHHRDLLAQILVVHIIAPDDFDDYMMRVTLLPTVTNTSKSASYFAIQSLHQSVNGNSQIREQYGVG